MIYNMHNFNASSVVECIPLPLDDTRIVPLPLLAANLDASGWCRNAGDEDRALFTASLCRSFGLKSEKTFSEALQAVAEGVVSVQQYRKGITDLFAARSTSSVSGEALTIGYTILSEILNKTLNAPPSPH